MQLGFLRRSSWRLAAGGVLLGSLLLAGCNDSDNKKDDRAQTPLTEVSVAQGTLRGLLDESTSTLVWKGVPYAKPPVGELRWRAPQAPEAWSGVREAVEPASECVQAQTDTRWQRSGVIVGSEDCLYVDIYRPARENYRNEKLPVYVWIHGGSNNFGSAKQYNGTMLAHRANAVTVFVQYRLGQLGWLNHPAVLAKREEDPASASGNFGTLDHIQALRWVKENIAAFGGDPDNITVAGESAGGHNVVNLLLSPLSEGLFHKAVAQSAAMATVPMDDVSRANTGIDYAIQFHEGLATVEEATLIRQEKENDGTLGEYLRSIPAAAFYAGYVSVTPARTLPSYGAYQDGYVLPDSDWMTAIRAGKVKNVPLIIGANEHEQKAFMPLYGAAVKPLGIPSSPYSWNHLIGIAHGESDLTVDEVLPGADRQIYDTVGYLGGRAWYAKYAAELAQELAKSRDDVYGYYFRWGGVGSGPQPFDFIYGAGHSGEIQFFHGANQGLFGLPFTPENEGGRVALQHIMMDYLANFLRSGNPNGEGLPTWKAWDAAATGDKAISFNADMNQALVDMSGPDLTVAEVRTAFLSELTSLGLNTTQTGTLWALFGQSPWPAPEAP